MSEFDPKNSLRKALRQNRPAAVEEIAESASDSPPPAVRPRRSLSLRERTFWGGLIALFVILVGWFLGPSGFVWGMEFSPDEFRHRSFWYVVWCGIPLCPPIREEREFPMDTYLREKGYVTPTKEVRWDFVKGFAPGVRGMHGSAKTLCWAMGCWGGGSEERIEWSEKNPELAAVVWPQVVAWAREDKYELAYVLLEHPDFKKSKSEMEMHELISRVSTKWP